MLYTLVISNRLDREDIWRCPILYPPPQGVETRCYLCAAAARAMRHSRCFKKAIETVYIIHLVGDGIVVVLGALARNDLVGLLSRSSLRFSRGIKKYKIRAYHRRNKCRKKLTRP